MKLQQIQCFFHSDVNRDCDHSVEGVTFPLSASQTFKHSFLPLQYGVAFYQFDDDVAFL